MLAMLFTRGVFCRSRRPLSDGGEAAAAPLYQSAVVQKAYRDCRFANSAP